MTSMILELVEFFSWVALWALGGWWLVRAAFNLSPHEQLLVGIATGLALENWLANLAAHFLPLPQPFWAAAALVFLSGLLFALFGEKKGLKGLFGFTLPPGQILALAGMTVLFTIVGRGMAILEDYQNLPEISLMATGDIPPHFALDPSKLFNYHYDTLLLSTQLVTVGHMYVWMALDIARGFGFALSLLLGYLYVRRVTRSQMAGFVGILMGMFVGGTRWLMLLLPESWLVKISENITMLGSAASSAANFGAAMVKPWAVDTGSPFPIPFAYTSGINPPRIWTYHAGAGAVSGLAAAILLLTHNRWRGWRGGLLTTALLASVALGAELSLVSMVVGFLVIAFVYAVTHRTWRIPSSLFRWLVVLAIAGVISLFQGGVITGVFSDILARIFPSATQGGGSYFTGGFRFLWPPAFLSTHLGYLSFANPYQAAAAFFEIGPMVIILPLVLVWGWKTYRWGRWYETVGFVNSVLSILLAFVDYTGSAGATALTRVQSALVALPKNWAVPVLWRWGANRSSRIKIIIAALFVISMFGGVVLFGFEMIGAARPTYSTFISILDARIMRDYWNRLEPGALVFDPIATRAPTVFGRPTDSNETWYVHKPEWEKLAEQPRTKDLRAYGFSYAYFDSRYWEQMDPAVQATWEDACVKMIVQEEAQEPYDFRRLYDIRSCNH